MVFWTVNIVKQSQFVRHQNYGQEKMIVWVKRSMLVKNKSSLLDKSAGFDLTYHPNKYYARGVPNTYSVG